MEEGDVFSLVCLSFCSGGPYVTTAYDAIVQLVKLVYLGTCLPGPSPNKALPDSGLSLWTFPNLLTKTSVG